MSHASEPSSPLHRAFTWDDEKAANQHRIGQARRLLGAIKVTVEYVDLETKEVVAQTRRAFVHLPKAKGRDSAYHRVDSVLGNNDLLREAYTQLRDRAQRFAASAKAFKDPDLQEMVGELESIINKMNGRFQRRGG